MQVVYGRGVSDEFDRQGLSAMIDYWISPAAVKREFEASKSMCFCFCLIFILFTFLTMVLHRLLIVFSKYLSCVLFSIVKYKLPSALFSSNVKLNSVWSALEGLAGESLEVPEACGLHPSPEVR